MIAHRYLILFNVVDENGNVLHWIGTCTDIGSTKQTELNLELAKSQLDSEKRLLSTVLEQLPVAVVVGLPPNGELVVTNRKLFKIWRQEEFDLPGNIEKYNIWQAFHPDGRPYEGRDWPLARSILHGEVVVDEDTSVKFGDGSHGIVRLNSAPVRDEQGRILAGVVIVEDVTGITRMTEERATMMAREQTALEACRLKSEFLANMSHEIRTPLNGVIGMADLLMETSLFANQEEYVSTIRKSGNLLLVIINDILDFSKVEAGKLQLERAPFHLQDIVIHVEKQLRPAADRQNIDFVIDVDPSLPPSIMGDSKRIKQILYNLVGNAIKFTKHGSVTLKIRPGEFDHGCSTYPLHIDVIDTGIGISETNQLRLFQPFTQADMSTTRKYGGTGLGLSICQGLVQLMGGSIQVQSKMNEGSMFSVDIQVEPANEHEIERPVSLSHKQVSSVSFCGFAALVAEDNKVNQMIVHKVLLKFKFSEVRITSNGKEVYETFCENPTKYAFILMDCQMPLMDGYEAARSIRDYERQNSLAPIPIIALTASALQSDIQACREAGMNDHIAKPFTHQVMASVLKRWFLERDKISRKNIGFML
jgi:signal transduction histidine kinase/CheY-like chemotaxis protein